MARKKIDIPARQVEFFATLGATTREIGGFFGVSHATIINRFKKELAKAEANKKLKLRQEQWKAAMNGNTAMLIFLGKNILGQSDQPIPSDDTEPSLDPKVG